MANGAMSAEFVNLTTDDGAQVDAYYAKPIGDGSFAGVVVLQNIFGVDEWVMEVCRRFAHHGYAAIAPNLYGRIGGLEGSELDELSANLRGKGGLNDDLVMNDVKASIEFLRAQSDNSGKVGTIGFCMGGRFVYLAAGKLTGIDASVDCWGGGVAPAEGQTNRPQIAAVDFTANITSPLLGIFGNDDANPNVDEVNRTEEALKQHGKEYEFHRYDGAGHGFWAWGRPFYRREQTNDAWDKTWAFFAKHLAAVTAGVG